MLGLALAMLLDQQLRGRNLARAVIFAPFVLSGAAVGLAANMGRKLFVQMSSGAMGDWVDALTTEHEMTLAEELTYMTLHGVLHLLGFDHETNDKAARQMYRLQDAIFEKLRKRQ